MEPRPEVVLRLGEDDPSRYLSVLEVDRSVWLAWKVGNWPSGGTNSTLHSAVSETNFVVVWSF